MHATGNSFTANKRFEARKFPNPRDVDTFRKAREAARNLRRCAEENNEFEVAELFARAERAIQEAMESAS